MDMDRYIGRLLDNRYEILEVLGSGGMAVVYKARCHRLNRLVAVKILKDENLQDEDFRRRFHAEGQAVAMLSHPNIVSVYDVSTSDDADYIVMELIDGITLKQYMEKKGVLNWKETLHFAIQIAKALEHAHSRGLVHRDIKPHNVMVLKNGSVRVADFGIARVMSGSNTLTKEALGSVHYISPEQAKGGRVDNRSDLYSLGVVMYEMITGRPPYDGESPVSVAIQHIAGGAIKPSELNPNVPAGLEQIILRAMNHDIKARYATASDMLADLDEVRKDPSMVFPVPVQEVAAPQPPVAPQPEKPKEVQEEAPKKAAPVKKEAPAKRPRTYEDLEISRGRVATAAVVICSVVAMVAIIVFLVILVQGDAFKTQEQMVRVPDLMNMHYNRLPEYDGLTIVVQSEIYSDKEAGTIIQQLPLAHTEVEPGRTVFVTVSKGPKPADITMPNNLIEKNKVEAQSILLGMNLGLQIEIEEAFNNSIPEGCVISVNPIAGSVLRQGQTVTITVSLGPTQETMPYLVGMSLTEAQTRMGWRGFTNVTWVPVDTAAVPANQIISQSVLDGEKVAVTAEIIVEYSTGKDPELPPLPPGTISFTFELPEREETYFLSILGQDEVLVIDYAVEPGVNTYTVELTGEGTRTYDVYINGEFYETVTVEFSGNE